MENNKSDEKFKRQKKMIFIGTIFQSLFWILLIIILLYIKGGK